MEFDITDELGPIDFAPDSENKEILQNVKTILTTLKRTVPMDRDFGIDGDIIDLPIAAAQARMTAEIVSSVHKFEPRAAVTSVNYEGKEMDGTVTTKVRVKIDGA
jgi:phage baseplate assembly protein W